MKSVISQSLSIFCDEIIILEKSKLDIKNRTLCYEHKYSLRKKLIKSLAVDISFFELKKSLITSSPTYSHIAW